MKTILLLLFPIFSYCQCQQPKIISENEGITISDPYNSGLYQWVAINGKDTTTWVNYESSPAHLPLKIKRGTKLILRKYCKDVPTWATQDGKLSQAYGRVKENLGWVQSNTVIIE